MPFARTLSLTPERSLRHHNLWLIAIDNRLTPAKSYKLFPNKNLDHFFNMHITQDHTSPPVSTLGKPHPSVESQIDFKHALAERGQGACLSRVENLRDGMNEAAPDHGPGLIREAYLAPIPAIHKHLTDPGSKGRN